MVSRSFLSQSMGPRRWSNPGRWSPGRIAGSGPSGPCACQQLAAHPVELTDVPPAKAAQEGPEGGWRLDHAAENTGRPTSTQRIRVVDAVAARHARKRPASKTACPPWLARPSARRQGLGDGRRVPSGPGAGRDPPAGAGRHWPPVRWSSKTMRIRSRIVLWQHLLGPPCFQAVGSVPKPLSRIQRSTLWLLQGLSPKSSFGGFGLTQESSGGLIKGSSP